jgi:hypothetical protein
MISSARGRPVPSSRPLLGMLPLPKEGRSMSVSQSDSGKERPPRKGDHPLVLSHSSCVTANIAPRFYAKSIDWNLPIFWISDQLLCLQHSIDWSSSSTSLVQDANRCAKKGLPESENPLPTYLLSPFSSWPNQAVPAAEPHEHTGPATHRDPETLMRGRGGTSRPDAYGLAFPRSPEATTRMWAPSPYRSPG